MSLRYFNPVGAHSSGLIGESPKGVPNNLFPYIAQTAAGLRDRLRIFGSDYPTPDGTGVRDYIHVVDLARGHLAALDFLLRRARRPGGTCRSTSAAAAATACSSRSRPSGGRWGGRSPTRSSARRAGDVAECVADPRRAAELFGWRAKRGLDEMCVDHWAYQSRVSAAA